LNDKKKVIVAPLHWGLGHATRCIPIIHGLLQEDAEVIIASDGGALALLRREFPHLEMLELPEYNIRYPFQNMILGMMTQLPKIIRGAVMEHLFLKKYLKNNKVDIIISDNRFGFYHKSVKSVFITHQIRIIMPFKWLENIIYQLNNRFINRFEACWIPDFEKKPNLSGKLSHGIDHHPNNIKTFAKMSYIAPLSRMRFLERPKQYQAIFILSGPEPQRTIFEQIIVSQLKNFKEKFCLVRGIVSEIKADLNTNENVEIHNYLTSNDLNEKIAASHFVVCRSGYSSIMDLWAAGAKAVLVPTPGQTEQIYLADYLQEQNLFCNQRQTSFKLAAAIGVMNQHSTTTLHATQGCLPYSTSILKQTIQRLLKEDA
jgi:uncharacterized protein (TIGR00661 family)